MGLIQESDFNSLTADASVFNNNYIIALLNRHLKDIQTIYPIVKKVSLKKITRNLENQIIKLNNIHT